MTQSEMKAKVFVALAKEYGVVLTKDYELVIPGLKNGKLLAFAYLVHPDLWMKIETTNEESCYLVKLHDAIIDTELDESGRIIAKETQMKFFAIMENKEDDGIKFRIIIPNPSDQYISAPKKPVGYAVLMITKEYFDTLPLLCEDSSNSAYLKDIEVISNNADCTDLNNIIQEVYNEMGCYTLAKSDNK